MPKMNASSDYLPEETPASGGGTNPDPAELAALQQLAAQRQTSFAPNLEANAGRQQAAAGAQAALMLGANLGRAIDKGIVAMSGSSTLQTDNQAYQNATTAAYAPTKIAEQIAQSEAQDLAVTKQRQDLELTDPTSQVNREFQKQLTPTMEKMGYAGHTPYMTIKDFTSGNGVFHGLFMANERRNERESAIQQAFLSEQRANEEWTRRNSITSEQADARTLLRKRGKGGGSGASPGGQLTDFMSPEEWTKFATKTMDEIKASGQTISPANERIILAGATNENMQRKAAEKLAQYTAKELLPQGEALSDEKKKKYADNMTENYESAMHVQGTLNKLDQILSGLDPEQKKIVMQAALTGQGVWDLAKNAMGKVAGALTGSDTERLNKLATKASVYVQQFKSLMVKEISGAQVAVQEYQRIANAYGTNNFSDAGIFLDMKNDIQKRKAKLNQGYFRNMPEDAMRYMIEHKTVGIPANAAQIYNEVYGGGGSAEKPQGAPAKSGSSFRINGKRYDNITPEQLEQLKSNPQNKIEAL